MEQCPIVSFLLSILAFLSFDAMIWRVLSVFCLSFFLQCAVVGQWKLAIEYADNSPETQQIVSSIRLKNKYKKTIALERNLTKIISKLHQNGYNSAVIDTIIIHENTYKATIFTGEKLSITQIEILGIEHDELQTLKIKPILSKKEDCSIEDIFRYNDVMANKLWNTGYPFATVKMNDLAKIDTGYKAVIEVEKHNLIILDSIITVGNLKLSKSFLYGYLGLKRKKAYNESAMKQVASRLQELPFAEVMQSPGVSFSDKQAALYIYANKRKTNQFDGYLGIVPNDEVSGKVLLTGSLTLDLNNILTAGENIYLNWKRVQVLSQNLDISVDFPYLFYSSFGIDGQFSLEKKDTSYLNMNFAVGVRYYLQQKNYLRAYYQYKNSRLIKSSLLEYLSTLPDNIDYNLHSYGLEVHFYRLDYIFNPRKGYAFSVNTALGRRSIIKNNNIADSLYREVQLSSMQLQLTGVFDNYLPIKKSWVWYVSVKAGHIQTSQLFENELFRLGGLKTLRGFDEQSIFASTYAIINNELRFIFAQRSYLQVFFDIAWYEKKLNATYLSDIPFGFGLGISFDTKAGIFAFNYALGKQLDNPIRFETGKITFGYTAVF